MEITAEFLKKNHSVIVAALIAEAITAVFLKDKHPDIVAELTANATAAGAEAERARIQGVHAQGSLIPGHQALVGALMWDGKTTGPDVAVAILAAEGKLRETTAAALKADGVAPVVAAAPPAVDAPLVEDENLPIEERAKAAWDKTAALRAEFKSYEAYLGFRKADAAGRVKILHRK